MIRERSTILIFEVPEITGAWARGYADRCTPDIGIGGLITSAANYVLDYYRHPNGDGFDNLQDFLEDVLGYNELTQNDDDILIRDVERKVQLYLQHVNDFAERIESSFVNALMRYNRPLANLEVYQGSIRGSSISLSLVAKGDYLW